MNEGKNKSDILRRYRIRTFIAAFGYDQVRIHQGSRYANGMLEEGYVQQQEIKRCYLWEMEHDLSWLAGWTSPDNKSAYLFLDEQGMLSLLTFCDNQVRCMEWHSYGWTDIPGNVWQGLELVRHAVQKFKHEHAATYEGKPKGLIRREGSLKIEGEEQYSC